MVPSVARYVVKPETWPTASVRGAGHAEYRMCEPANCQIMPKFKEGETLGRK